MIKKATIVNVLNLKRKGDSDFLWKKKACQKKKKKLWSWILRMKSKKNWNEKNKAPSQSKLIWKTHDLDREASHPHKKSK
jgi:hypothetical protein